jgi:diphthamide synthase (EF-2-diphthine--ammonia ligase)
MGRTASSRRPGPGRCRRRACRRGRSFDRAFLAALPPAVDRCGENGEFHTFVTGGAGFDAELNVTAGLAYARTVEFAGRSVGYHFAPLRLTKESSSVRVA